MSSLFSTLTYERPSWEGSRLEYLAPADGQRTAPQVGTGGLICPVLSSPPILNTTGTILSLEWFFWPASSSLLEEVLSSWCGLSTWAKSKSQVLSQALFMYQSERKGVRIKEVHHLSFLVFETKLHYVFQAALELTVATNSKMFQLHKYCNYMCITTPTWSLLFYTGMPNS